MQVQFKDTKAEVRRFQFRETYSRHMSGTKAEARDEILEYLEWKSNDFDKGWILIEGYQDEAETELKDFRFYVSAATDDEHDIFVTWFDDAPDPRKSIAEIIEEVTRKISFADNCRTRGEELE